MKQISIRINEKNLELLNKLRSISSIRLSYNQLINTIITSKLNSVTNDNDLIQELLRA